MATQHVSESCSVVAAIITTVAFATVSTVPGGSNRILVYRHWKAFDVFSICFTCGALLLGDRYDRVSQLSLNPHSRYQEKDFQTGLPNKLILGLISLFLSFASMLVSFCAGHFFVLKDELKFAAFPVYGVTCLPVTLFAAAYLLLCLDLIKAKPTMSFQSKRVDM